MPPPLRNIHTTCIHQSIFTVPVLRSCLLFSSLTQLKRLWRFLEESPKRRFQTLACVFSSKPNGELRVSLIKCFLCGSFCAVEPEFDPIRNCWTSPRKDVVPSGARSGEVPKRQLLDSRSIEDLAPLHFLYRPSFTATSLFCLELSITGNGLKTWLGLVPANSLEGDFFKADDLHVGLRSFS